MTKSFQNWFFYIFAHFLAPRPSFYFAQVYREWVGDSCIHQNLHMSIF